MKGSTTLSKGGRPDVFRHMQKGILKVKDSFGKYVISLSILFLLSFHSNTCSPNENGAIYMFLHTRIASIRIWIHSYDIGFRLVPVFASHVQYTQ